MQRIAIIGNAGGGKSVLARDLGARLDLPVYEVDQFQWQPGWVQTPLDEIAAIYKNWLEEPSWIIDGWGDWDALRKRFDRADTIVMVDLPIVLHYWWARRRQVLAFLGKSGGWPPQGCSAWPITWRLFKLMWHIHREMRPRLLALIDEFRNRKTVAHLRSRGDVKQFLNLT